MKELYKQWCKETKRNGAILVHSSINEFFEWLELNKFIVIHKDIIDKAIVFGTELEAGYIKKDYTFETTEKQFLNNYETNN